MMMDKNALYHTASEACNLLKCLANPHRLMLVCHLLEGRKSVNELVALVGISQSNMSQHLAQLRLNGVVAAEREAQTIYYSVANPAARAVLDVLYQNFCAEKPPTDKEV